MNELQRQQYLSAFGMDSYMPRWCLPHAAVSVACELGDWINQIEPELQRIPIARDSTATVASSSVEISPAVIADLLVTKPVVPKLVATSAADILAQLDVTPSPAIEPFSLSIWRPFAGVMVIDSRNTKLALPTELLLKNIFSRLFDEGDPDMQEEVLRWPMIENSFAKRTLADARNELQTWLTVQHEIRPLTALWLMGSNAAQYLLPESVDYVSVLGCSHALSELPLTAMILPSLNELLQKPALKRLVSTALYHYQSSRR